MKLRCPSKFVFVVAATLLLAACAAAKPIGEWHSKRFTGQVDNILIIGVTSRSTRRRVFEDQFVDALAAQGVKAVPSYQLITSTVELTREQVEQAIRGQGLGAVLVTRLAGVKEKAVYRLPSNYDHYRSFNGYYDHVLAQTNSGYYSQYRELTLETNLWDTASRELIWSMQSETMDASQPRHIIEAQIALTIDTLASRGLLPAKP